MTPPLSIGGERKAVTLAAPATRSADFSPLQRKHTRSAKSDPEVPANARDLFSLSSPKGGEGRGEEALRAHGESLLDVRCSVFSVRRSQGRRAHAFTLIELMVVIALIGILSALIIPEMKGTFEDSLLRSTSRDLVNIFSIAASRAVSQNQLHRVRLETKTGRYVIEKRVRETTQGDEFVPIKDDSESEGRLDTRISIQIHTLGEPSADSSEVSAPAPDRAPEAGLPIDSISFYPDGTADRAELLLRDRQGFRLALVINPITSRVKILQLDRE